MVKKIKYYKPIINWCDFQMRICKNNPEIKWVNKVHERLDGFKTYTMLPDVEYFALYHPKTIDKQEQAVKLYQTINPNVKEKI
jgi:hypothetical protein